MRTSVSSVPIALIAVIALGLAAGCSSPPRASKPAGSPSAATVPLMPFATPSVPAGRARIDAAAPALAEEVTLSALSLLGVPYRWGGTNPSEGLDCSGLVQWVYRGSANLLLPRRSDEMMAHGQPVTTDALRSGDLVFFNTMQRTGSHVGIYIGQGRFIHAPNSRGVVRIESLDQGYWASRYDGARRLIDDGSGELASQR